MELSATHDDEEWGIDLAEDIDVPGWLFIPEGMDSRERARWVKESLDEVSRISDGALGGGRDTTESEVRAVLEWGIEERRRSPSLAVFQVWPMRYPTAVMSHINVVPSAGLPSWAQSEAVVHPIEAPHVGPGLQCTVKDVVWEDGQRFDLTSMHLIFDNGDVTLMLSIDEAPTPLITFALPGLFMLMDNITMARRDGLPFSSIAADDVLQPGPWQVEETR